MKSSRINLTSIKYMLRLMDYYKINQKGPNLKNPRSFLHQNNILMWINFIKKYQKLGILKNGNKAEQSGITQS